MAFFIYPSSSVIHSSASSVPGSSRLPASGRLPPPRLPFRSRIPVPRSSDSSWQSLLSGIIVYRWSFIVHCFGRNPLSAGSLKGNAAGAANPPPLRRRNGPPPLQRADSGYAGLTPLYPQKTMGTSPSVYPPFSRAGDQPQGWWWVSCRRAAFPFNGICGRRFLPSADYGIPMDPPLPRRSCSSLFTFPCHSKLP